MGDGYDYQSEYLFKLPAAFIWLLKYSLADMFCQIEPKLNNDSHEQSVGTVVNNRESA